MSEEEFYNTTPKKLFKLAEIHREISNPSSNTPKTSSKPKEMYIDQMVL